jgi:hypothetical protein
MTVVNIGEYNSVCVCVCVRVCVCVYVCVCARARSASVRRAYRTVLITRSVEQKVRNLRNLRQTVRGSMLRVHLKTGMLKKRALYWQLLVSSY